MNIKALFPHYMVREEAVLDCDCDEGSICECMPGLVLTRNGLGGQGMANWTYTDDTCPRHKDDHGKAYWCEFLGLPGFWAIGETDAADELRIRLNNMGFPANVNYVDNDCATKLKESL